jgi:hypothetical protein
MSTERLEANAHCDFCGRIDDCYTRPSGSRIARPGGVVREVRICGGCVVRAGALFAQQAAGHVGEQAKRRLGEAAPAFTEVFKLFRGRK